MWLKSESSKAVGPKIQNIDIGPGFQGSPDDVIDLHMDLLVQDKKLKNHVDEEDTVFTDLPDFSAVEKVSEPIKQFKRISLKEEGNYFIFKCTYYLVSTQFKFGIFMP